MWRGALGARRWTSTVMGRGPCLVLNGPPAVISVSQGTRYEAAGTVYRWASTSDRGVHRWAGILMNTTTTSDEMPLRMQSTSSRPVSHKDPAAGGAHPKEKSGRRNVSSGTQPARTALSCSDSGEPTDPYRLIGTREIVGHGTNGSPMYSDDIHYPYPAIRFREISPAYKALKEKERGDWKGLTLLEKKCLYRISFCQTVAEMIAPTGEWKSILGWVFFWLGVSILFHLLQLYYFYSGPWPVTFEKDRQKEQLKRMRDLGFGRIQGINEGYDYGDSDSDPDRKC